MASFRQIPSIDQLLQRPALVQATAAHGHAAVAAALSRSAAVLRARLGTSGAPSGFGPVAAAAAIESGALADLASHDALSLRVVLNATGVLVHTNLGRAPLARSAAEHAAAVGVGYSNLEYDLAAGVRGHRHVHAEALLSKLTGAEAAVVTNNNAAATWLALTALARGREVVVSRGELVEIGGGFRVPDILAQSGATLREVGTTNRTRVNDYAAAIGDRTAMLLRVHPSNFRMEGFTERPSLADLVALAHRFQLPLFEDLGSGWLGLDDGAPWPAALDDEPSVIGSLKSGVDLVAFSGDKLLGGPQAGILVGRRDLIAEIRRHPMMRAVRADKLAYAALEATLSLWAREPARAEIPLVRMLLETREALDIRARALASALMGLPGLTCTVIDGDSTIGGGSAPQSVLPTRLVALRSTLQSSAAIEAALRAGDPPVVARVQDDAVLFDLRTIEPRDDERLGEAIRAAFGPT